MKNSKPCPVPWDFDRPFRDVMRNGEHDTEDCNFLVFDLSDDSDDDDNFDYIEVHGPNQEANAELIREAVNCHDRLTTEVENLKNELQFSLDSDWLNEMHPDLVTTTKAKIKYLTELLREAKDV